MCPHIILTVEWMRHLVEKGDIVIIEFGHFEGGGPIGAIRNNILCPGLDPTVTCERSVSLLIRAPDRTDADCGTTRQRSTAMMGKCSTPSSSKSSPGTGPFRRRCRSSCDL